MAQIKNRFDIQNEDLDIDVQSLRRLPNFFDSPDEIGPFNGILLSILTHGILTCLFVILTLINGLIFPHLPKPNLPMRDVEFKLVQNESKPPINKNTKIRSDRDSQAGGKHDPKRPVSEPSAPPAAKSKPAPKAVQKQAEPKKTQTTKPLLQQKILPPKTQVTQPKAVQQQPKPQVAQPQKVVQQAPAAPKTPAAVKPALKPAIKPEGVPTPSAPKIATAPKSPFNVPVPPAKAPVGTAYRPAGTPGTSGGSSSSGSSSGTSSPAPKFSTSGSSSGSSGASGGSSSGSAGSKYASRGGGGSGSAGNPSPGNPNGTPGIDAVRQPNWGPYMRDLEQRIKRNWSPPKGDSSKRVVITFTIARDGRLLSHKVTKSSNVPLADQAAMKAIELTAPFKPLPPEFKGTSVPIEFTFDYNVLNSVVR